jgi:hypothetical protein
MMNCKDLAHGEPVQTEFWAEALRTESAIAEPAAESASVESVPAQPALPESSEPEVSDPMSESGTPAPDPESAAPDTAPNKGPVSERRLAANRARAQKSTGPRTPEGRRRSALNATCHGILSQVLHLPEEELGAYSEFTSAQTRAAVFDNSRAQGCVSNPIYEHARYTSLW